MGDRKPVFKNVRMTAAMNNLADYDPNRIMNGILQATETIPGGDPIVLNRVQHGYVGATNPTALNGETDWYKANEKIGDSMRNAIAAIKKAKTPAQFARWLPMADESAKLVIDLRNSDFNRIAADRGNGISRFAGGRPVSTKPYSQLSHYDSPLAPEVSRDQTISDWKTKQVIGTTTYPALSRSDAVSLYDTALQSAHTADGNRHKMAIEAAYESRRRINLSCG
jgi:hypothetical protein